MKDDWLDASLAYFRSMARQQFEKEQAFLFRHIDALEIQEARTLLETFSSSLLQCLKGIDSSSLHMVFLDRDKPLLEELLASLKTMLSQLDNEVYAIPLPDAYTGCYYVPITQLFPNMLHFVKEGESFFEFGNLFFGKLISHWILFI